MGGASPAAALVTSNRTHRRGGSAQLFFVFKPKNNKTILPINVNDECSEFVRLIFRAKLLFIRHMSGFLCGFANKERAATHLHALV